MHIAFFSDQHPATIGGLQVSLGLQRKYLERRGHAVTVCAPRSKRTPSPRFGRADDVLVAALQAGEHSFSFAGAWFDHMIDRGFARKAPVDCVHVQGDVWGAWNGYRFAARHRLPLVHTMHTNLAAGVPAVMPFPRTVFHMLFRAQERFLRADRVRSVADYTRAFADRADVLVAPSAHFVTHLRGYGLDQDFHVLPTGVDEVLTSLVRHEPRTPRSCPILVWAGRVSREKRIVDFLTAFARSGADADIQVYGSGNDLAHARRAARDLGVAARVTFFGVVSHQRVLWAMRNADAVVQSSLGFETQGLTCYEAVSVGTPVILRDRTIALDLPPEFRFAAANDSLEAFAETLRWFVSDECPRGALRVPSDAYSQSLLAAQAETIYRAAQEIHHQRHVNPRVGGPQRAA